MLYIMGVFNIFRELIENDSIGSANKKINRSRVAKTYEYKQRLFFPNRRKVCPIIFFNRNNILSR